MQLHSWQLYETLSKPMVTEAVVRRADETGQHRGDFMSVKLMVLAGSHEGKEIAINQDKFLIGRSDECHLRPKSESVSRRHCAIIQKDGRVLLLDLKSRNGTFVNDKQLSPDKAKILKDGDKLRIGKLEFTMVIEASLASTKKPEVKSISDAAERTVAVSGDSKYEEVDISSWLEEADQIDRSARARDPETRQFKLDDTHRVDNPEASGTETISAPVTPAADETIDPKTGRPIKKPPMKLPKNAQGGSGPSTATSRDAANETLKKLFGGGR